MAFRLYAYVSIDLPPPFADFAAGRDKSRGRLEMIMKIMQTKKGGVVEKLLLKRDRTTLRTDRVLSWSNKQARTPLPVSRESVVPAGGYTIALASWEDVGRDDWGEDSDLVDDWDEDSDLVEAMKSHLKALLMARRCPDIYLMRCAQAFDDDDSLSLLWWTNREESEEPEEKEESDDDDDETSESSEESTDEDTRAYHKSVYGNGDGDDEQV